MSEHLYILSICLPLGTVLLIFAMRYVSAVQQARARLANDDAYRLVAHQAVATQSETVTALSSVQAALTEIKARLNAVEKVLKDVE